MIEVDSTFPGQVLLPSQIPQKKVLWQKPPVKEKRATKNGNVDQRTSTRTI